jgi:uncharacterized protein (TIGR02246 family)
MGEPPPSGPAETRCTEYPMITKTALGIVCVMMIAACGDSPGSSAAGSPMEPGSQAAGAVARGQEDRILALIDAQSAAWAAKDGIAYGATYTEDASVVNPVGGLLAGRTVIANQHVFLFNPVNGPFRQSTSSWTVRNITFLTGTIALVELDVTLTGFSALPPGLPAVEPGVVRTRVTWIAVHRAGTWLIMHQQMTPLPPA